MNSTSTVHQGITAESHRGMTILRSTHAKPSRRILYLNSYGMAKAWREIREGTYPGQHLWGCLELLQQGYEVAMPEEANPDSRFFNYRRQDLRHVSFARSWLRRDDIIYSAHTILFWTPLLAELKLLRSPIVSLLYARGENLRFTGGYRGILAMTPAAEDRAKALTPKARISHIGWGVDLSFYPASNYNPQWFLSCGKTRRDFATLAAAAAINPAPIHVINTKLPGGLVWPSSVKPFTGGRNGDWITVSYDELIHQHYTGCSAALVVVQSDSEERYAAGFTQVLEAMALARPVILTCTGAVPGEIDVEKEGCGLLVPANDPEALAKAMKTISDDPARAAAMGQAGRRLCETRYDIRRYARDLHTFFEAL